MAEQLANDIQTLLAADISAVATKLKPLSAVGFPPAEFRIRVDDELMLVTATGAEWTVERGVEGTAAAEHEAGVAIYHLLTKAALLRVQEEALAGKQPLDADLSLIAALTTTPFGRGFLALASAAAGRSALELGTAAQQPSTAFDLAGAASAAQAASQPLDADLTAIAALTTTPIGRSLLASASAAGIRSISEAAAALHAATHQFGGSDPLQLPQYDPYDLLPYLIPMGLTPGTTQTPTAKRGYFTRFTVGRKRGFKFVRLPLGVVGTGEDKVDVAIYRVNGAKMERLSSNGGVKVNFTLVGVKVIELGSEVICEPGIVYFVASAQETVTGTPQMLTLLNNNGSVGDMGFSGSAGTVSANRLMLIKNEAFPLPAEVTAVTGSSTVTYMVPSEL